MRPRLVIGVILIVLGIVALAIGGINYTTKEKVLEVGPLKAEAEKEHTIPLPPVLGAIALIGGIVLVAVGARGR
jgi:hypothetical protein